MKNQTTKTKPTAKPRVRVLRHRIYEPSAEDRAYLQREEDAHLKETEAHTRLTNALANFLSSDMVRDYLGTAVEQSRLSIERQKKMPEAFPTVVTVEMQAGERNRILLLLAEVFEGSGFSEHISNLLSAKEIHNVH